MLVLVTVASDTGSTNDDTMRDSDQLEKNPLLLTGAGLCILVVLLSIVFVCYRQWKSRRLASKLTLTSTPTHEALLSRTDQTDNTRRRIRQQSTTAAADESNDLSQK